MTCVLSIILLSHTYYSFTCVVVLLVIYHPACLVLVIYNISQLFILHLDYLHSNSESWAIFFCTPFLRLSDLHLLINQSFLLKKSAAQQSTHGERTQTPWKHFGEHMVGTSSTLCCYCSRPRCLRGWARKRKVLHPGWCRGVAAGWLGRGGLIGPMMLCVSSGMTQRQLGLKTAGNG
jgi:hypothetical protein